MVKKLTHDDMLDINNELAWCIMQLNHDTGYLIEILKDILFELKVKIVKKAAEEKNEYTCKISNKELNSLYFIRNKYPVKTLCQSVSVSRLLELNIKK
ncbi:MAG: hypothetical protein ACEQSR_01440 [Candidatus Methylacidiphilales bacterium]